MSTSPPDDPWGSPGSGTPGPPPPPPGGGYPPPPGGGYGYPPPAGGGYPGGGYPPAGGYGYGYGGGSKGLTPFGPATGWWRRVGATLIDGLVLVIPNFIVDAIGGRGLGSLLSLIISASYITIMLSRTGQTVGNMAVGTRVIDASTGGPITGGKAFIRWASQLLLFILFVIPLILDFLWPLWDRQNQTLHDKMAGTLVIRTN